MQVLYARHGFPLVHNKREDFYAVADSGHLPEHHAVVTNPPFSGDHIHRALTFCADNAETPWAMLLPSTVLERPWWDEMAVRLQRDGAAAPVAFVAPTTHKYEFDKRRPSGGGGGAKKAGGCGGGRGGQNTGTVAPEVETVWFAGGMKPAWASALRERFADASLVDGSQCVLAEGREALPKRILAK